MGFFKAIKRVMSGSVVRQVDVLANGGMTTVSVRLKKNNAGEKFVVLAFISTGNYQYCSMDTSEFRDLITAMHDVEKKIDI